MWRDKMKINYRDKVAYLLAMYDAEGRRLWPRATKQAAQPRPATKGIVTQLRPTPIVTGKQIGRAHV